MAKESYGAFRARISDLKKEQLVSEADKKRLSEEVLGAELEPDRIKELVSNVTNEEQKGIVTSALRTKLQNLVKEASENNQQLDELIEKFYSIEEYVQIYEPTENAKELGLLRSAITNIYNSEKNKGNEITNTYSNDKDKREERG